MLRDRFILPAVDTIAGLPPEALIGALVGLAALQAAIGARLSLPTRDGNTADDAVDQAEAMRLLKLQSPRWLRSVEGKKLRCPHRVGGRWMYSRRKIAAFLRDPLP
jgi:hypothetical protein